MGRPKKITRKKLTQTEKREVVQAFAAYIVNTEDPHLAGFLSGDPTALKYWVNKDNMYDWAEVKPYTELALLKSEAFLLKDGRSNQHTTFSIFRLKQPQHGYKDRVEQELTSRGEPITFINAVPRPGLSPASKIQRKAKARVKAKK